VISGKKLFHEDDDPVTDLTYYLYKTDELIIFNAFNNSFRTCGRDPVTALGVG
jgi:hypothetical protein